MGQWHGVNGGFKAVAVGGIACVQAQRTHWHHGATVQRHQPVRGAHEADAGPARQLATALQLVTHDLGNGQLGNGFVQGLLQTGGQVHTGHNALQEQGFGLAVHLTGQAGHGGGGIGRVHAHAPQALEQRWRGIARRVQAHGHRHELQGLRFVSSTLSHGGDVGGQATGRRKRGQHRIGTSQALRL